MASIETGPLSHHLDEDEIAAFEEAFEDEDIELDLDEDVDAQLLEADLDEDILADFMDQLDANDASCDIYIPGDFEDILEVGEYRVGSAHALLLVLEEIRDEIFEDEEEEEEEEEGDYDDFDEDEEEEAGYGRGGSSESMRHIKDDHMRHLWKLVHKGARAAIREGSCLFIHR